MLVEARRRLEPFGAPRGVHPRPIFSIFDPDVLGGAAPVDAVFSTATFHWVLDHDLLFANLAAVLRARGPTRGPVRGARATSPALIEALARVGGERAGTWLYASPADTVARLEAAGFVDIEVWTNPEPTPLEAGRRARDASSRRSACGPMWRRSLAPSGARSWPRWRRPWTSPSSTTSASTSWPGPVSAHDRSPKPPQCAPSVTAGPSAGLMVRPLPTLSGQ